MALLLMATLLWGGCLSCAQYFMFPSMSAKICCMPSGECKKEKHSKPSSPEECRIQPLAFAKAAATPERVSILSGFMALSAQAPTPPASLLADFREKTCLAYQASPPDLCLLHSALRI